MPLLGTQYIITLENCPQNFISDPRLVAGAVISTAQEAGLSIIQEMEHRFEPQGLTLMLLLSQSHLIAHTWPEYDTMIVDVFVCVTGFDLHRFASLLQAASGAGRVKTGEIIFEHRAGERSNA